MVPYQKHRQFFFKLWGTLVGDSVRFSMENRLFNAVAVFIAGAVFFECIASVALDIPGIIAEASGLAVLVVLYYFSRFKQKFKVSAIVFCFTTYLVLIANYFTNAAISGPTLLDFMATLILVITLGPIGWHRLWIALHIIIVAGLLTLEYFNIGHYAGYDNKAGHFFDIGITYSVAAATIYFVTLYIRNSQLKEKRLADQYAASILKKNEELEELNQIKNRLFSLISHDLRSPLNSIQGYLEVLTDRSLPENAKNSIQDQLLQLTKHTQDMLFNLLSWSKSQISGYNIELQEVNLFNTLNGTVDMLKKVAEPKGVLINNAIEERINVVANVEILQLVVRNFIQNAIKFTHTDGEIHLHAEQEGAFVVISVKDNGIGIPLEKQPEIFSSKLKSTYGTKKERGIGLGLYLCKELVELQGGKIWFTSTPGIGSQFNVSLAVA